MTSRPSWMPPREVLTGYLVALIPPSITTLDEQLDLLEEEFVRAVDRALAEPRPAAPLTQRMFDLVRYQRHELHDAGLLTDQEFGDLIAQGSGSARRLENYDRVVINHRRELVEARIRELDLVLTVLRDAPGWLGIRLRRDGLADTLAALRLPPHATDEAERAADAATPGDES